MMTMSGSEDVTAESVSRSLVYNPDSSVEFKTFAVLLRCGLGSPDICSTKNTSESVELIETLDAFFGDF